MIVVSRIKKTRKEHKCYLWGENGEPYSPDHTMRAVSCVCGGTIPKGSAAVVEKWFDEGLFREAHYFDPRCYELYKKVRPNSLTGVFKG